MREWEKKTQKRIFPLRNRRPNLDCLHRRRERPQDLAYDSICGSSWTIAGDSRGQNSCRISYAAFLTATCPALSGDRSSVVLEAASTVLPNCSMKWQWNIMTPQMTSFLWHRPHQICLVFLSSYVVNFSASVAFSLRPALSMSLFSAAETNNEIVTCAFCFLFFFFLPSYRYTPISLRTAISGRISGRKPDVNVSDVRFAIKTF